MAVNDCCRLCETNLRVSGVLANSKLIFDSKAVDDVSSQLSKLGLIIENTPLRSYRVCRKCCTIISRLLHDTKVLQQWKDNEKPTVVETCLEKDATASASTDKRNREPSPSKTPITVDSRRSTNLPVPERSSMTEEAMKNSDAAVKREHLIICDNPTPDKDRTSNMSIPVNPTPSDASDCSVSENNFLQNPDNIKKEDDLPQVTIRYDVNEKQLLQFFSSQCPTCQSKVNMEKVMCGVVFTLTLRCPQCGYSKEWKNLNIPTADGTHQMEHTETTLKTVSHSVPELGSKTERTSNMSVPVNPTPSDASDCSVSENNFLQNPDNIKKEDDLPQVKIRYDVNEKQLLQFFSSQCPTCQSKVNMEKVMCGVVFTLTLRCPQCGYSKEWKNLNIIAADDTHQMEHTETTLKTVSHSVPELGSKKDRTSDMSVPVNPTPSDASDCSVSENNFLQNPDNIKKEADLPQVTIGYDVNEKQLLQLFSSQCPTCQSKVNMEKVMCGVVFTLTLRCPQCGYSKEWKNLKSKNIPAADDPHQTEATLETVSDSVPKLDSVPVNPTPSDASDCSVSENNFLQNPDIIKKKADPPQVKKKYVVNEKQLLQLFSSQCPTCQSKVNMEKVVCGVVLTLSLKCLKCGYCKEWKNLESTNIPAADDTHQTEATVETASDSVPEFFYLIAEDNCQLDLSDVSSGPSDKDSGEEWDPENELSFGEELRTESDDEDDDDEDIPSRLTELCTDCGTFFKKGRPHTCEHIIKPVSCNTCGKRFINELSLTYHTRVHNASYEVSCKCCHMKFKTKTDKTVHERKHLAEEKPFKCLDCSETFATYHERMIHLKVHRGGPEGLKCRECGLKFSRIEGLRRHIVVHTGEKPHKCVVCERSFNQAGNLKSHMRLHTGEKPYKCQHCYQGFNHNVSLKSHIKRYHTPGSENQQKKTNKRKHGSGDYQTNGSKKGADSWLVESEQDTDDDVQLEKVHRRKPKKNSGKPKGRPKRNKADRSFQAEEAQEQSSDTNT